MPVPLFNTYNVGGIPCFHDNIDSSAGVAYMTDCLRRPSMRGRLCPSLTKDGVCSGMSECAYSHTVEEARRHNQNFKTKICEFAANGFCKRAHQCRFAHSFSELSPESDCAPECKWGSCDSTRADSGVANQEAMSPSALSSIESSASESHVCYVAPPKQRKAFRHRPRVAQAIPVMIPSAFHYVEQNEKRRRGSSPLLPTPSAGPVPAQAHPLMIYQGGAVVYAPMMYNMMMPRNVVYED